MDSITPLQDLLANPKYSALEPGKKVEAIRNWEQDTIDKRNASGEWDMETKAIFDVESTQARQAALGIEPMPPRAILESLAVNEEEDRKNTKLFEALDEVEAAEREKREINSLKFRTIIGDESYLDRNLEVADDKIRAVGKRVGFTDLEEARQANEVIQNKRDAAVVRGKLVVKPDLYFDREAFVDTVKNSSATPREKARVLAEFTRSRENLAKETLPEFQRLTSFNSFAKKFAAENADVTNGDVIAAFKQSGSGDWEKTYNAMARGLLSGVEGIGYTGVLAGDLLKKIGDQSGPFSTGIGETLGLATAGRALQDLAIDGPVGLADTAEAKQSISQNIETAGGLNTGQKLAEVGAQLGTQIFASLATGALTSVPGAIIQQGAKKAAKSAAGNAALRSLAPDAAKKIMATGAARKLNADEFMSVINTNLTAFAIPAAGSAGPKFYESYERHRDQLAASGLAGEELEEAARTHALTDATRTGIVTGAVTRLFGLSGVEGIGRLTQVAANPTAREALAKGTKEFAKNVTKKALGEGFEEAIDEGLNGALDALLENPDMTFAEWEEQVLFAGLAGAVFGGAVEAPVQLIESAAEVAKAQIANSPEMIARNAKAAELREQGLDGLADTLEQANVATETAALGDALDEVEADVTGTISRIDEIDAEIKGDVGMSQDKLQDLYAERENLLASLNQGTDPATYNPEAVANTAVANLVSNGMDPAEARQKVVSVVNQKYSGTPITADILAAEAEGVPLPEVTTEEVPEGASPDSEVTTTEAEVTPVTPVKAEPTFRSIVGRPATVEGETGDIRIDADGVVVLDRGPDAAPIEISRNPDDLLSTSDLDVALDEVAEADFTQAQGARESLGSPLPVPAEPIQPTTPARAPRTPQNFNVREDGAVVTMVPGGESQIKGVSDFVASGFTEDTNEFFVTVKPRNGKPDFDIIGDDAIAIAETLRRNSTSRPVTPASQATETVPEQAQEDLQLTAAITAAVPEPVLAFDSILTRLILDKPTLNAALIPGKSKLTKEDLDVALEELTTFQTQVENENFPPDIKARLDAIIDESLDDLTRLSRRAKAAPAPRTTPTPDDAGGGAAEVPVEPTVADTPGPVAPTLEEVRARASEADALANEGADMLEDVPLVDALLEGDSTPLMNRLREVGNINLDLLPGSQGVETAVESAREALVEMQEAGAPLSNEDVTRLLSNYRNEIEPEPTPPGTFDPDTTPLDASPVVRQPKQGTRGALDDQYFAAIEAGDMDAVQRMVDEAAKKAVLNNPRTYLDFGHYLPQSEYTDAVSKLQPLPKKVFYVRDIEVIRNPSDSDRRRMTSEVREDLGRDSSGDPATRFTNDEFGNTWIWKAIDGMHASVEPGIQIQEGVRVSQNNSIVDRAIRVQSAIRNGEYIPEPVQKDFPRYKEFLKESSSDPITYDAQGNIIPLSQRFNVDSDSILEAAPWENTGFYSKLTQVVTDKLPNRATPQQILATIDPTRGSGVKAEEIKWSGIEQAVDRIAADNNGMVPKQELIDYLNNEGAVKFEEVVAGGSDVEKELDLSRKVMVVLQDNEFLGFSTPGEAKAAIKENPNWADLWEVNSPEDAQVIQEWRDFSSDNPNTQYGQYQLPGGTNYKEVVLAMPSDGGASFNIVSRISGEPLNDTPLTQQQAQERLQDTEDLADWSIQSTGNSGASQYTSNHFAKVPNYVAHMRTNERTDSDGRSGLFIEEIQSDRHQAGRKKGYQEPRDTTGWSASKVPARTQPGPIPDSPELWQIKDAEGNQVNFVRTSLAPTEQDAVRISAELLMTGGDARVADAPFRKDWHLAMFKRALRDAVASGKEWIGWTTGETQNDRFDLSNQVAEISFERSNDGTLYQLYGEPLNGEGEIDLGQYPAEKLSDVVGKDLTEKILANPEPAGSYAGEDLKVGGSGMKGFYDNILPKEIGKYVKQWGAKVEQSSAPISGGLDNYYITEGAPGTFWIMDRNTGMERTDGKDGPFESEEDAKQYLTSNNSGKGTPIWKISITPEMKRSVQSGQPLFAQTSTNFTANTDWTDVVTSLVNRAIQKYPNIPIKADPTSSSLARTQGLDMTINPVMMAESTAGMGPAEAAQIIDKIVIHEATHRAALTDLDPEFPTQYAAQMTVDEKLDTARGYLHRSAYATDEAYNTAVRQFAGVEGNTDPRTTNFKLGHEALRMLSERLRTGYTTEETIAFLKMNPNLLQRALRYLKAYVNRLKAWATTRKDPTLYAEMSTLNKAVWEMEKGPHVERGAAPFIVPGSQVAPAPMPRTVFNSVLGRDVAVAASPVVEETPESDSILEASPFGKPARVPIRHTPEANKYKEGGWLTAAFRWDPRVFEMLQKSRNRYQSLIKEAEFFHKDLNAQLKKEFGKKDQWPTDTINLALGNTDNRMTEADVEAIKRIKSRGLAAAQGDYLRARALAKQQDDAGMIADAALTRQDARAAFDAAISAYKDAARTYEDNARLQARTRAEADRDAAINSLPDDLQQTVRKMRLSIDALSRELMRSGAIPDDLRATIDANQGLWLHRSYRIFDQENYAEWIQESKDPEAEQLRNKTLTFVRDDLLRKEADKQIAKNPGMTRAQAMANAKTVVTPEDIQKSFNGFLHVADGGVKSLMAGATISKDVDALMKRGVIPKEIQELWGVYTDPTVNAAKSLGAVAQFVTQQQFLTNLVDLGTSEGWLSKEQFDAQGNRLYELAPNNGMTGRYNGSPSTQWAPLSGYYGPRALADAIGTSAKDLGGPAWMKFVMQLTGYSMASKTVLSWQSVMRNFWGNILFTVANGNLTSWNAWKTANKSIAQSWSNFYGNGSDATRTRVKRLIELGVFGDAMTENLIKDLTNGFESDKKAIKFFDRMAEKTFISKVTGGVGKVFKTSARFYSLPDEFWKVVAFEGEIGRVQKYMPNATPQQQEEEAARIVKATMPTYSQAPEIVQLLRRNPFIAPFITFTTEVYRTSVNTVKLAAGQITEGIKTDNKALLQDGLNRTFGIMLASAGVYGVTLMLRSMAGFDSEDEDDLRNHVPVWDENSTLMILPTDRTDGKIDYMNISYMNPYDVWSRPFRAFVRGLRDPDSGLLETSKETIQELFDPVLSEQIFAGAILDVARGVTLSGKEIYDKTDSDADKITQSLSHIFKQSLMPGTLSSADRIIKASQGYVAPGSGRSYDKWNEIFSGTLGMKFSSVDTSSTLQFSAKQFKANRSDSIYTFSKPFKSNGTQSDDAIMDSYIKANAKLKRSQLELYKKMVSAVRLGTMTQREALRQMKADGVTDEMITDIAMNRFRRYEPSTRDLNEAKKKGDKLGQDRISIYRSARNFVPRVEKLSDEEL